METALLVARIAAVAYLSTGLALLNGNLDLKKTYVELNKSPLYTTMLGAFTLLLGMLIINHHNVWVKDWTVLVTIIGWVLTVEGVLYLVSPKTLLNLFQKLPQSQQGWGIFTIALGVLLGYFGFVA